MAKLVTMYISMYSVSHDVYYWSSNIIMFYVWIMDINSISLTVRSRYDTVNFSHKITHGGHPVVFLRGQDTGCLFREFKVYCMHCCVHSIILLDRVMAGSTALLLFIAIGIHI